MLQKSIVIWLFISFCYRSTLQYGVVKTDCGLIQGYENTYLNTTPLWTFFGIPFAVPPEGEFRWKPPTSLKDGNKCWSGTLKAANFGPSCIQGNDDDSEDCLTLNIWAPLNATADSNLPVFFYIHGGSLMEGSGNSFGETPWRAAAYGNVISVSINYRLNAFGYLALDILSSNDPRKVSGNYGLLDQVLALQWVQNNIKAFGGNPSQVTLWGQSSGGTAIFQLLLTPSAKGLFHRAISMSGSPNVSVPLKAAEQMHIDDWLLQTRCANVSTDKLLECLYSLNSTEVYNAVTDIWSPPFGFGIPEPNSTTSALAIIDGVTVPLDIWTAFEKGQVNDVPSIFGVMAQENDLAPVDVILGYTPSEFVSFIENKFAGFGPEIASQVLELYPLSDFETPQEAYDSISSDIGDNCGNIALGIASASGFKSNVYVYVNTMKPPQPLCPVNPGYCPRYSFHMFDMLLANEDYYPAWNFTSGELKMGNLVLDRFLEFARTGKVSEWLPFAGNNNDYNIVEFNIPEQMQTNYKKEKCNFWKENGFDYFMWQN